jgi:hypothetical protein
MANDQGDFHDEARRHLAPYVNEVTDPFQDPLRDPQSVFMGFDYQGSSYYLLENRR